MSACWRPCANSTGWRPTWCSRGGRARRSSWRAPTAREVGKLTDVVCGPGNQAAAISSGSYPVDGMIIAPCSMKSVAGIRTGCADGLIGRAVDVTLKERRRLVLAARDPAERNPFGEPARLSQMGAVVLPPTPAFYTNPASTGDLVEHTVARILDQFALPAPHTRRWKGLAAARADLNALPQPGD
ncbi:UbiX family flavin prenyltransferase [Streptomyces sp. NPDC050421]|uniref:UbiX family flavin prenyltransferase n=1 Tax=unclassified Streptomyces TaxID=2593676 RepID=UPI0037B988F9